VRESALPGLKELRRREREASILETGRRNAREVREALGLITSMTVKLDEALLDLVSTPNNNDAWRLAMGRAARISREIRDLLRSVRDTALLRALLEPRAGLAMVRWESAIVALDPTSPITD